MPTSASATVAMVRGPIEESAVFASLDLEEDEVLLVDELVPPL